MPVSLTANKKYLLRRALLLQKTCNILRPLIYPTPNHKETLSALELVGTLSFKRKLTVDAVNTLESTTAAALEIVPRTKLSKAPMLAKNLVPILLKDKSIVSPNDKRISDLFASATESAPEALSPRQMLENQFRALAGVKGKV